MIQFRIWASKSKQTRPRNKRKVQKTGPLPKKTLGAFNSPNANYATQIVLKEGSSTSDITLQIERGGTKYKVNMQVFSGAMSCWPIVSS